MNDREKVKLLRSMGRTAKTFCEDEGISRPIIEFIALPKHEYGKWESIGKSGIITLDVDKENDYVETFFHELIHHWQHTKVPTWYNRKKVVFRNRSKYLNSNVEVEARSFARSICEDLDS